MKILIGAVLLGALSAQAQTKIEGELTVFICQKTRLGPGTLFIAKSTAQRLFAEIGVQVAWRDGTPSGANTAEGLVMTVSIFDIPGSTIGRQPLGAAWPFEGKRIDIFYGRIEAMDPGKAFAPVLLGYVLTHEITHNLQAVNAHSKTGIMKSFWTPTDLRAMAMGRLTFESGDIYLIDLGIKARQSPAYRAAAK